MRPVLHCTAPHPLSTIHLFFLPVAWLTHPTYFPSSRTQSVLKNPGFKMDCRGHLTPAYVTVSCYYFQIYLYFLRDLGYGLLASARCVVTMVTTGTRGSTLDLL